MSGNSASHRARNVRHFDPLSWPATCDLEEADLFLLQPDELPEQIGDLPCRLGRLGHRQHHGRSDVKGSVHG